jgi:hypothetical protein
MKRNLLLSLLLTLAVLTGFEYSKGNYNKLYFPAYKKKSKPPKEQRAEGQAEERSRMLFNYELGRLDSKDWYEALAKVIQKNKNISSRAGDLNWEKLGPLDIGGRSRGFVFDNQNPKRCYTSGVSGGLFVSDDLGLNWREVPGLDKFPVLPIGCMIQSKNGDIYAGTGELWGNTPGGDYGSQFYGAGIYKKAANSENFEMLSSTFTSNLSNIASSTSTIPFKRVVEIGCDPENNDKVLAATDNGLYVSTNAGSTWTKVSGALSTGVISQIKSSSDPNIWYAGKDGAVYKSTNGGTTWNAVVTNQAFISESNRHLRIAVSKQNPNKLYAIGIKSNRNGEFKFAIRSSDGGATWTKFGEQNPNLNLTCSGDPALGCQGWYDLCLAVHPTNDDLLYAGGQLAIYVWSPKTSWVQAAFWNRPAVLFKNLVHADMHEFAFHPKNPDTLVCCTDGGIYMSFDASKQFPNITFRPRNKGFQSTQFYDLAANIYGDVLGGTQDNGTQLVHTGMSSPTKSDEVNGGDGFDVAISAAQDYKTMFYTVYFGSLRRSINMNNQATNIIQGTCIDLTQSPASQNAPGADGSADNVNFHTRIHLAESRERDEDLSSDSIDIDKPKRSLLFMFANNGNVYVTDNAHKDGEITRWVRTGVNPGISQVFGMHQTADLSTAYMVGSGGIRKVTGLDKANFKYEDYKPNANSFYPCASVTGISFSTVTGITGGNLGNVYVRQTPTGNNHEVVVTQYGFGGTSKVFYSKDGNSFEAKQGDLPVIPVYCAIIDEDNPNHVLIGTEFGIYETDNISVPGSQVKWVPANKNVGSVPVFRMRQERLKKYGCWMVYIGTHGRGFFQTKLHDKEECKTVTRGRPKMSSSIEPYINLSSQFAIYPNPAQDIINITFESKNSGIYNVSIFDQSGRFVKKMSYKANFGVNNITAIDITSFAKGTYFVRLENGDQVIGGDKFIVK